MGSAKISRTGVTDRGEFYRRAHDVDLNRGSGSCVIIIKAVSIHKNRFSTPHLYEFHYTSMDKAPAGLRDAFKYGFYLCASKTMKLVGNESNESSSKDTSE